MAAPLCTSPQTVRYVTELDDVDHVEVDDVEYLGHLVVGDSGEEGAVVVEGHVLHVPQVRPKVLHELQRARTRLFPVSKTYLVIFFVHAIQI